MRIGVRAFSASDLIQAGHITCLILDIGARLDRHYIIRYPNMQLVGCESWGHDHDDRKVKFWVMIEGAKR